MKTKKIWLLLSILCVLLAVVLTAVFVGMSLQKKTAQQFYEDERQKATVSQTSEPEEQEVKQAPPVDIKKLQETMPDAYAWINIPGTVIDYPIVQHPTDNSYYMYRTSDGKENVAGSIFTENYNTKDFQDPNTLIYGHNMKDGSMFATLHKYEDKGFFDQNKTVYIYTEDDILEYQIFAAYLYDNRHLMQSFNFNDPEVFSRYLEGILDTRDMSSNIDRTINLTKESHIITLSTCDRHGDNYRYLVQAVMVEQ